MVLSASSLRPCYAMSGTDLLYPDTSARGRTINIPFRSASRSGAKSHTKIPSFCSVCTRAYFLPFDFAAACLRNLPTLPAYALPTECPVLTQHMLLPAIQLSESLAHVKAGQVVQIASGLRACCSARY
eukprot:2841203-Rhodomonas_salina.3